MTMKKQEKYINCIETVLVNRNIDNEETDWQQSERFNRLINSPQPIYITDSVKLGIDSSELLLMVKLNSATIDDKIIESIKDKIKKRIEDLSFNKTVDYDPGIFEFINIIFFVSSIKARVTIKNKFAAKETADLVKAIKKATGSRKTKLNTMFYLDKDVSSEEIKISNIRRYEMITLPPLELDIEVPKKDKNNTLKGYVFTANLYDIVSLYNTIGDQIFRKNVRFGIEDKLEVDKSIRKTLEENPEAFWFRNNGITILVEQPNLLLDRVGEIVLKEATSADIRFSVINGAQTITAAAEYYYSIPNGKHVHPVSTAKVIVKIIHINNNNAKEAEKEAKNISVALNRQKPIKTEDIAFTNDFVEKLNDYLESKDEYMIVRRGEEYASNMKTYSLINFAKARKACSGDPGPARSNATATLLKISPDTSQFTDHNIFIPDWYSASSEKEKNKIFDRYYSPVLFAMDLADKSQSIAKNTNASGAKGNVIKNGMWYFIAYIVYILNDGNDTDYSDFDYTADKVTSENLNDLFEQFADFYCRELKATELDTVSNIFKTSDKYKELKAKGFLDSPFYQNVCDVFGKRTSNHHDAQSNDTEAGIQVIIDGITTNVSNNTEAFIYTIEKCLEKSTPQDLIMAVDLLPFLTFDEKANSGYFFRKEPIFVHGITMFVGKQSNTSDKISQLNRLCVLLKAAPNTIIWKNRNSIIFEY